MLLVTLMAVMRLLWAGDRSVDSESSSVRNDSSWVASEWGRLERGEMKSLNRNVSLKCRWLDSVNAKKKKKVHDGFSTRNMLNDDVWQQSLFSSFQFSRFFVCDVMKSPSPQLHVTHGWNRKLKEWNRRLKVEWSVSERSLTPPPQPLLQSGSDYMRHLLAFTWFALSVLWLNVCCNRYVGKVYRTALEPQHRSIKQSRV